jgi:hypothetical protein
MICRSIPNYCNYIHRICTAMTANIILRSNCNYKSTVTYPIHGKRNCTMNVRGFCSRQCNLNRILRNTLPNTICNYSNSNNSPTIRTSIWVQYGTHTSTYKTAYTDACKRHYTVPVRTAIFLKVNPRELKHGEDIVS